MLLPFRSGGLTSLRLDTFPHTLGEVWVGLLELHPTAIIELGLLLLIVALGVLAGAFIGSHLLVRLSNRALRMIFLPIMTLIAIQMVLRGFGITL